MMSLFIKLCRALVVVSLTMPALALADQVLDRIEIIQTKTEADIHIEFLTQVHYLRHFPTNETDNIQIFLELPELKDGFPTRQEFRSSPPSDIVPSFSVNLPGQATNSITIKFSKPVQFRVSPDNSGRGLILHIPLEKQTVRPEVEGKAADVIAVEAQPLAIDAPTIPAGMSIEEYTEKLMADGNAALGAGDNSRATQIFNTLLNLPPHRHSQEAQELVGLAREKNGELAKAKVEYELYLKLYPAGEGATRVRQHLAAVEEAKKTAELKPAKAEKEVGEIHENTVYGGLSQYYYDGHTHAFGTGFDTSRHDLSFLLSNLDITGRFRHNQYDNKIVFRETHTLDFLPGDRHDNRNRVRAAYFEMEDKDFNYMIRLGRQAGNSGGILGRFDGALLRFGLSPTYRVNLVAGSLDEADASYKRNFYGVNLDIGPLAEKWSGNAYFITQKVDGITERSAVGAELRYFDNNKYLYSLFDYDTVYKKVNIATLQGSWQTESGINFNLLADHRKTPILQLINGLFAVSPPVSSVRQALNQGVSKEQLKDFALAQTASTDTILLGVTRQMTPRWQLGGDVSVNRTSGLKAAGVIPATPDTGTVWTYSVQAIGLDTLFKHDTTVINASYAEAATSRASGPTSQIYSLIFSNTVVPRDKLLVNSSLKLVRLVSDPSITTYTVAPTLRVGYLLRERMTLEAEIGLELINAANEVGRTNTLINTGFIGYRWDF